MRNAFMDELINAARVRDDIALIIGDLGYSVIEPFADEFPDRFFNAGIAEQNMMGMAAGMASEGMQVFTYSIGNFPTWRCAEQIRNDVDYHNLAVTNVVVGGGVAYGSLGYSHHAIQDYALMRSLPNMAIASPGDPVEVRAVFNYIIKNKRPYYLRLGKSGEESHNSSSIRIDEGKWNLIKKGSHDKIIISTGAMLTNALNSKEAKENKYSVYSMPLWSQKTAKLQLSQLVTIKKLITYENHLSSGGFGSYFSEIISNNNLDIEQNSRCLSSKIISLSASEEKLHQLLNT